MPAARRIARQHGGQSVSRVAFVRAAILVMHGHRHKHRIGLQPGQSHPSTLGRAQHSVRISGRKNERRILDIGAKNIEINHRDRHANRALIQLGRIAARHTFAAHASIEIAGRDPKRGVVTRCHPLGAQPATEAWWMLSMLDAMPALNSSSLCSALNPSVRAREKLATMPVFCASRALASSWL